MYISISVYVSLLIRVAIFIIFHCYSELSSNQGQTYFVYISRCLRSIYQFYVDAKWAILPGGGREGNVVAQRRRQRRLLRLHRPTTKRKAVKQEWLLTILQGNQVKVWDYSGHILSCTTIQICNILLTSMIYIITKYSKVEALLQSIGSRSVAKRYYGLLGVYWLLSRWLYNVLAGY